jgi:MGT family glycosyltransferase
VGGRFFDLFTRYPVEAADAKSFPIPSRLVTYAAVYAERLTDEVAALGPGLIVYDTFAVVAPLIARRLGVPYVNVCAGHAAVPPRVIAELRQDPRVAISAECWAAVKRLKEVHGMSGANPFSFVETQSPFLNLYCEPREFLGEEDRAAFEPIAFFGSLAPDLWDARPMEVFPRARRGLKVYVSFGTVIWRYYEAVALAALAVISRVFADLDADVVISLGRRKLEAAARASLEGPNVRVVDYTDQWAVLREADVFITHHGLNSTHEAIFHEVPMISYPFFGDQPAQAHCCQHLGLAVPLASAPQAAVERSALVGALKRLAEDREGFAARLAEARSWELRTIADRGAVIDRVLALTEAPRD